MSPELRDGILNGELPASGWRSRKERIPARGRRGAASRRRAVELDAALYEDLLVVLGELDLLLDCLPETKIREFTRSEAFPRYQRVLQTFLDVPADWNPRA